MLHGVLTMLDCPTVDVPGALVTPVRGVTAIVEQPGEVTAMVAPLGGVTAIVEQLREVTALVAPVGGIVATVDTITKSGEVATLVAPLGMVFIETAASSTVLDK